MFNILSWNVLAQDYIDKSYDKYKDYLDFDYRSKKIIYHLKKLDSDIIFLQEVDYNFYKLLKIEFKNYYFGKLIKNCWNECKTHTFNLIMSKYKLKLIKIFKLNEFNNSQGIFRVKIIDRYYYLVNIHLYDKNNKIRQMELTKILNKLNNNMHSNNMHSNNMHSNNMHSNNIIIGGDFNNNIINNNFKKILDKYNYINATQIENITEDDFTYQLNDNFMLIDFFVVKNIDKFKTKNNLRYNLRYNLQYNNTQKLPILKYYGSDHLPILLYIK